MELETKSAVNKHFWHVTPKNNEALIFKEGIIKSEDGNFGEGVYCIEEGDLNSLKSVLGLESFEDNGYELKDLAVVEFQYSGNYQIFKPIMRSYHGEKWVIIKEKINQNQIIKTIKTINSEDF